MQKCIISCVMTLSLFLWGITPASATEDNNPVDIVTSERWMMSKQENKLAYVLSIESAIYIET